MDQKLMREFVEKKLKRVGYTNIAAANFPCGVWIKEDTKLYAVCLFDDPNKLAADPWRIDRVVDYAAQKVREQKQLECQFLALVLSDDFSISEALAAIVFGIVIALNVQACGVSEKKAVARSIMKAGVIAGVFLFTVYGLLAWLGARGSAVLAQAADGTAVLSGLCLQFFGPVGALLLAAIFFVACFNVCTGLLSSCAAFFHEKFPRFSFIRWLQAFTMVSFLVSILGLELILKISVPILTLLYPVAIAIIVINLLPFAWAQKPVVHRVVTVLAFAVSIWSMF